MRWKVRKKNNRGSSLVMVIVSMAIITLLVTMVLSLTIMNFRMKHTNLNAQKNFYTAEEALDEIRQGLAQDLSLASSDAYLYTMSNYNNLPSNARYNTFCSKVVDSMRSTLSAGTGSSAKYNPDYLAGMLTLTAYDSATGIGAKVSSLSNGNGLNVTSDAIILKNVIVSYYGQDDYYSEIQTDIVLSYPVVELEQASEMPDLLNYSLVANDSMTITGTDILDICGNVYMGKNGAVFSNGQNISIHSVPGATSRNTVITNKGISINTGSKNVDISDVDVWADSILVDGSQATINGNVYLSNDLVLDNNLYNQVLGTVPSTSLTMTGELWAYGNPDIIGSASSMLGREAEIAASPADYSSSIILNGPKTSLDLQNLTKMIIGGEAYVGASRHTDSGIPDKNTDVLTGESIAVKANQTAYLVPPECVAPGSDYGGMNPMPATQYNELIEDLCDGGKKTVAEAEAEVVAYDVYVKDLGCKLSNINVNGYQKEFYAIQNYGNMVYLFMKFDSEASASAFTNDYFNKSAAHYSKLTQNLELYKNQILIPSALSDATAEGSSFYCNGAIVTYGTAQGSGSKAKVYASDDLNQAVDTEDYLAFMSQSKENRDVFSAMQCKLTRRYYTLTAEEKTRDVYNNLVYPMASMSNSSAILGSGSRKEFASDSMSSEKLGAVVINNAGEAAFELTSSNVNNFSGENESGATVSGARLCVVIASGDVKVSTDFKGLILAGGKITFDASASGKSVEPDPSNVALALNMVNGSGVKVGDYLIGSDSYTIGGLTGGTATAYSPIYYLDLVTYENWKKQ